MRLSAAPAALLAAAVLAISIAGCSSAPSRFPFLSARTDYGARYEKQVFFALKAVKATDEQRLQVLQAFDVADPQLSTLSSEGQRVSDSWRKLDPRDKNYQEQAEQLAKHQGELSSEKLRVRAEFNRKVAAVLDHSQWSGWTNLFRVGSLNEDGDPYDFNERSYRRAGY